MQVTLFSVHNVQSTYYIAYMRSRDKKTMKLYIIGEMAMLLMEQKPELSREQALSTIINSSTYDKLMDDETGLYFQSPRYVFSYLADELTNQLR